MKNELKNCPFCVEEWRSPWEYFDSNYEITHWMPLPDAPKGEEQ